MIVGVRVFLLGAMALHTPMPLGACRLTFQSLIPRSQHLSPCGSRCSVCFLPRRTAATRRRAVPPSGCIRRPSTPRTRPGITRDHVAREVQFSVALNERIRLHHRPALHADRSSMPPPDPSNSNRAPTASSPFISTHPHTSAQPLLRSRSYLPRH